MLVTVLLLENFNILMRDRFTGWKLGFGWKMPRFESPAPGMGWGVWRFGDFLGIGYSGVANKKFQGMGIEGGYVVPFRFLLKHFFSKRR